MGAHAPIADFWGALSLLRRGGVPPWLVVPLRLLALLLMVGLGLYLQVQLHLYGFGRSRVLPFLRSAIAVVSARSVAAPGSAPPAAYWRGPALSVQSMQAGVEWGDADYDGYFENHLFKETHGGYPLMIVGDIFFHCPTSAVHVVSRFYVRSPQAQNHSDMVVEVADPVTGARVALEGEWFVHRDYETSAVGIFPFPRAREAGGLCGAPVAPGAPPPPPLRANVTFHEYNASFLLAPPAPQPPPSRFAMCAVFSFNNYMLGVWARYWALLGINTFYMFYNGDPGDIPALNASLASLRAHVVWVQWPLLHWIMTDSRDVTHGQPMAIVDCLQRWRERHAYMFFYDLDEFLVLPRHSGIAEFMDDYEGVDHGAGPIVALRTQSAWAMFNLTRSGRNIADVDVSDFAALPVMRGPPAGREKYWFNTSAVHIEFENWGTPEFRAWTTHPVHNLNLHGVYLEQLGEGLAHVRILHGDAGQFPAYHLHLLNTRTPERTQDGRDAFMPKKPLLDAEVGPFVRRMLSRRLAEREHRRAAGRAK
jgi:hypothetical protein